MQDDFDSNKAQSPLMMALEQEDMQPFRAVFTKLVSITRERDALRAENERLRAEVKDYRENGAAAVQFAPSSAYWSAELRRLFSDNAREGIEVLEQRHRDSLTRAERLREALEMMVEMVEMNGFGRAYAMDVARATLAKENSND